MQRGSHTTDVIRVDISVGMDAYIPVGALDELRQVVRLRRREMGLSQSRVAVLCGLSRQALSRIETGVVADLGLDKVERLALVLGFKLRVAEAGK